MPVVHLTARMRTPHAVFLDPAHAGWFWASVANSFPGLLAETLMPNHPHVLADVEAQGPARVAFGRLCGQMARRVGIPDLWEPVPPAQVVVGADKIRRMVRYIALNPCRAGLASDPLQWLWSTHRDIVGAVGEPCVELSRLAAALGVHGDDLVGWLHAYVSSDPSVHVNGTWLPSAAPPRTIPEVPLGAIARAATISLRA